MRVHNYYSDILSRLYMFLNTDVFSRSNSIQSIQYNLGSASTVVEYKDSYDLPSAMVKYDSLEPWSSMPVSPRSFQMVGGMMKNPSDRFTVIYNDTKGIELDVQMQYFALTVSVTINCKSQMQAINMSHEMMQRMPVDRMLNQFSFISFFELDDQYLNPMIFDIQNDFITNLFITTDPASNEPTYSFSYGFTPLMKLSSVPQISMDDMTKSSYQLTSNFEIYLQVPQFMISDNLPGSSRSADKNQALALTPTGKLVNPTTTVPCYYNYLYFDVTNGSTRDIIAVNPIEVTADNKLMHNGFMSDGKSYSIEAGYIGDDIKFNYTITYKGELLSGYGVLFVYNSGVAVCRLGGDLYGNILMPQLDETSSTLSGIMLGNSNGSLLDNEPLVLDLDWFRKRPAISSSSIIPANYTMRSPAVRDLYSVVNNVNAYRSILDFNQTSIVGVKIITISNDVITTVVLTTPYILLPDGSFSFLISTPSALSVSGRFNKSTSFIDSIVTDDPLYAVLTLDVSPTWDYLPYGSNQFDSINFDLGGMSNTSIPTTREHDAFINRISTLDTNYVSVYSSMPYSMYNSQYTFSIPISSELASIDPTRLNETFEIYFIHNGQFLSSATTNSFMLDLNSSLPTDLVFKSTEDFRLRVLDNISKYSPLYFGVIILP